MERVVLPLRRLPVLVKGGCQFCRLQGWWPDLRTAVAKPTARHHDQYQRHGPQAKDAVDRFIGRAGKS